MHNATEEAPKSTKQEAQNGSLGVCVCVCACLSVVLPVFVCVCVCRWVHTCSQRDLIYCTCLVVPVGLYYLIAPGYQQAWNSSRRTKVPSQLIHARHYPSVLYRRKTERDVEVWIFLFFPPFSRLSCSSTCCVFLERSLSEPFVNQLSHGGWPDEKHSVVCCSTLGLAGCTSAFLE